MTIIKGRSRGNGVQLANYLQFEQKNEEVQILEVRGGFAGRSLCQAFVIAELMAGLTNCQKPFYHAQIRLAPGEHLTETQWRYSVDRLEDRLALSGHDRAIVLHRLQGQLHCHIVWDRIHPETFSVAHLAFDALRRKAVARELEIEFGLTRVRNRRAPGQPAPFIQSEVEQARRSGRDPGEIRTLIVDAWVQADTGRALMAALASSQLLLARGSRRDFVVVDPAGQTVYALGKRMTGATAAETRQRLADLDPALLPSVEEAKAVQIRRRKQDQSRADFPPLRPKPAAPDPEMLPQPDASPTVAFRRTSAGPRPLTPPAPTQTHARAEQLAVNQIQRHIAGLGLPGSIGVPRQFQTLAQRSDAPPLARSNRKFLREQVASLYQREVNRLSRQFAQLQLKRKPDSPDKSGIHLTGPPESIPDLQLTSPD